MTKWAVSRGLVPYPAAVEAMESRAAAVATGREDELVWLLEHPALYTAGASADPSDLRDPNRFPVFETSRGGQYTYHGPGQRVAYLMLDLSRRGRDIRRFVCDLEGWIIDTLAVLGVHGERRAGRVGVWVPREGGEDKIAAIGVRVRRWVSYHGISINVRPDLEHFAGITPCGVSDPRLGVASLKSLGVTCTLAEVDAALLATFSGRFGSVEPETAPI